MHRVVIVGTSGSGKTRLARALSERLGVPHIEVDALHHGPNWTIRDSWVSDVTAAVAGPRWVLDGNYGEIRERVWQRADTVIWIDLPRWLSEWQVLLRSLHRWLDKEPMWNGNREPGPRAWFNAEHPIRWSWAKHPEYRAKYAARFAAAEWEHVHKVRLRSRAEMRNWLRDVT